MTTEQIIQQLKEAMIDQRKLETEEMTLELPTQKLLAFAKVSQLQELIEPKIKKDWDIENGSFHFISNEVMYFDNDIDTLYKIS